MTVHPNRYDPRRLELACDHPAGCEHTVRPVDQRNGKYPSLLRAAARLVGWSTRPTSGPGARTDPDLCHDHREKP